MGDKRLLFRSDDEWPAFAEGLKQTSCPHCKVAGSLNKHGFLYVSLTPLWSHFKTNLAELPSNRWASYYTGNSVKPPRPELTPHPAQG